MGPAVGSPVVGCAAPETSLWQTVVWIKDVEYARPVIKGWKHTTDRGVKLLMLPTAFA